MTEKVEHDLKIAQQKFAAILNATNPDLKAFKKRGGKLHGWNDAAIPAEMSINYYDGVTGKMGQSNSGAFIRLYMIPGMRHCAEGPGPNQFGQTTNYLSCDAKQDIRLALEKWGEKGISPGSITATKFRNELRQTAIVRTRPLCRYPQAARYKGSGSTGDAANFVCQAQK